MARNLRELIALCRLSGAPRLPLPKVITCCATLDLIVRQKPRTMIGYSRVLAGKTM
jgi:hypothetical protein